jgi:carbonic anhydrase
VHRIETLLAEAKTHAVTFDPQPSSGLTARPTTSVAIVCCMDARIDLFEMLGLRPGDAHIIRNAGGIVTDDVIRSLLISQRMLGTTAIMLIHHTGCGMQTFTDDSLKAEIEAETGLRPPFALEAFPDLDADVRQSIARIKASPYLPHRDIVRGFVYEVESGHLREVRLPFTGIGRPLSRGDLHPDLRCPRLRPAPNRRDLLGRTTVKQEFVVSIRQHVVQCIAKGL